MSRIGQNRIYTYIHTIYLVIYKPELPYVRRTYMVLANPIRVQLLRQFGCYPSLPFPLSHKHTHPPTHTHPYTQTLTHTSTRCPLHTHTQTHTSTRTRTLPHISLYPTNFPTDNKAQIPTYPLNFQQAIKHKTTLFRTSLSPRQAFQQTIKHN
jgi:hypothetical protein